MKPYNLSRSQTPSTVGTRLETGLPAQDDFLDLTTFTIPILTLILVGTSIDTIFPPMVLG